MVMGCPSSRAGATRGNAGHDRGVDLPLHISGALQGPVRGREGLRDGRTGCGTFGAQIRSEGVQGCVGARLGVLASRCGSARWRTGGGVHGAASQSAAPFQGSAPLANTLSEASAFIGQRALHLFSLIARAWDKGQLEKRLPKMWPRQLSERFRVYTRYRGQRDREIDNSQARVKMSDDVWSHMVIFLLGDEHLV